MVIIQLAGGLGNQLQQYALYKKFQVLGKDVKLDVSWFENEDKTVTYREIELDYFEHLDYKICSEQEKQALLKKTLFCRALQYIIPGLRTIYVEKSMYDPQIFKCKNMYIEGYFACEMYYADIIPLLQSTILFSIASGSKNELTAKTMQNQNSISLHIRRGDYLNSQNEWLFGNICTEKYYRSALMFLIKKYPDSKIYVFSDDIEYVRQEFRGENYIIVDWNTGKNNYYDMYLMSQCKYNICANSTFSFWGARLNQYENKIMIRPLKQRNNMEYEPKLMHRLWKEWIFIDEKGNIV